MANCIAKCQGRRGEASRLGNSDASASIATWETFVNVYIDKDGKGHVDLNQNGYNFGSLIFPKEKMERDIVTNVVDIENGIRNRADVYVNHVTNAYYALSYHRQAFDELEDVAYNAFRAVISNNVDDYNRRNKGTFKIMRQGHIIYKTEKNGSRRFIGLDFMMLCHDWEDALLHEKFIHSVLRKIRKSHSVAVELRAAEDAYHSGDTALAKLHAGRGLVMARKLGNDLKMTNLYKTTKSVDIVNTVV